MASNAEALTRRVTLINESGKLPDRPQQPSGADVEMSSWWTYACSTARRLRADQPPPVVEIYGPLLHSNECGRLSANLVYSRLYGGNASYSRNNLFAFGSLGFMVGAMGVIGITPTRSYAPLKRWWSSSPARRRSHQHMGRDDLP